MDNEIPEIIVDEMNDQMEISPAENLIDDKVMILNSKKVPIPPPFPVPIIKNIKTENQKYNNSYRKTPRSLNTLHINFKKKFKKSR